MIIYECDMCGKQQSSKLDYEVSLPVPSEEELPWDDSTKLMLCRKCAINVSAFIQGQRLSTKGAEK